jgi:thiol-disulfide isomerase/thioredoxin
MKRAGAIFVAIIIILAVAIGGLSYVYLDAGQSGYSGQTDDDSSDDEYTPPDDGGDGNPNAGLLLAPDFTLPKVGGGSGTLSNYRGKVVLLDFMATWCGPCVTELEHLKEVDSAYSSDVVIFSIDVDQNEGDALLTSFGAEHGITWPILMDTGGISQTSGYSASSIPTLVVVNKDGYIRERYVGVTQASVLESIINTLL